MSKNKKNTIKSLIIMLSIILLVLLATVIIIYSNPINRKLRYIYNTNKDGNISIMPTNVDKLFMKYDGDLNQRSIYKSMDYFVNEVVEKYFLESKNIAESDYNNYYEKNKNNIEKELGITEKEKFKSFMEFLNKSLTGDNLELISYTINPSYLERSEKSVKCSIIVNYENNSKIAFNLYVQKFIDESKTPIYFEECSDEDIISYEYESNNYETPDSIEPTGKVL